MTTRTITIPAPIPTGSSLSVAGPVNDQDVLQIAVAPVPPPPSGFDVDYSPATLTGSGLATEVKANPGKIIGLGASRLGGWSLTAPFRAADDAQGHIIQLAPIRSSTHDHAGAFYARRPHWTWEMAGAGEIIGPTKLADIAGHANANNNEQEHGIRQDGGDAVWVNPKVSGFHGDCMAMRLWAKANGGDDVAPLVHIHGGLLTLGQRCGIGVIVCRDGSLISGVTFDQIGTWPIDVETNAAADKSGRLVIDGCTFRSHGIAGNGGWGMGGVIAAIQYAGPSPHGPETISNCTGDQLDIGAKNVASLSLLNLRSTKPAKILLSNSKVTSRVNVVNIS